MLRLCLILLLALTITTAHAQFEIQDSTTTADLRGIVSVGNGTAWASGTHGTVLRTEDGGFVWQGCTTPPGAEKLDFRGIQAFDDRTAIVMSSGKGDLSRIYKTTDGCVTWKLVFTNPDADGFFDGLLAVESELYVLGDSVAGKIVLWSGYMEAEQGDWQRAYEVGDHTALQGEGSFAASNSVLVRVLCNGECEQHPLKRTFSTPQGKENDQMFWRHLWFASQAAQHSLVHRIAYEDTEMCEPCRTGFSTVPTPMSEPNSTGGIFSLAFRDEQHGVAVGGDYAKASQVEKTAATTSDAGKDWSLSASTPHGYRSSVSYDAASKTWITVGPNGTDISTDDGKNWKPLRPGKDDQPDADLNWNALSLPFVVGPHGRIGRLRDDALTHLK